MLPERMAALASASAGEDRRRATVCDHVFGSTAGLVELRGGTADATLARYFRYLRLVAHAMYDNIVYHLQATPLWRFSEVRWKPSI